MLRNEWKFQCDGHVLATAALNKVRCNEERLEWWKARKVEIASTICVEGSELDDEIVVRSSFLARSEDRGRDPEASVRNDRLKHFRECCKKFSFYTAQVKVYAEWEQVLRSVPCEIFNLDQDDWLFFFGSEAHSFRKPETYLS